MYTDKLSGKTFVVIGASSGIGRALASALLVVGAKKVHIASSNADRINKAVETVRKEAIEGGGAKGEIVGSVIDLKSEEKVKEWFDNVGKFDHLVITAGEHLSTQTGPDYQISKEIFDIRYFGPLFCVKASAPYLSKEGSITFTIGTLYHQPMKGYALISSVLGAVVSLAKGLAVDLAPIRINVIAPGFVDTELWSEMPEDAKKGLFEATAAKLPVGHVGKPDEIVEGYLYLMRCAYVTGEVLHIDGGHSLV